MNKDNMQNNKTDQLKTRKYINYSPNYIDHGNNTVENVNVLKTETLQPTCNCFIHNNPQRYFLTTLDDNGTCTHCGHYPFYQSENNKLKIFTGVGIKPKYVKKNTNPLTFEKMIKAYKRCGPYITETANYLDYKRRSIQNKIYHHPELKAIFGQTNKYRFELISAIELHGSNQAALARELGVAHRTIKPILVSLGVHAKLRSGKPRAVINELKRQMLEVESVLNIESVKFKPWTK